MYIKNKLRALCSMTYTSDKLLQLRRLRNQHAKSSGSVVVHQMSKVGSQTVVASLRQSLSDYAIYHTHFLSQGGLKWLENFVRERWGKITVPTHLWHGLFVRDRLYNNPKSGKLKIVTLVRDPVIRNISEFFQELDVHMAYPYKEKLASVGIEGVTDELEKELLDKLNHSIDWKQPYPWFESEIKSPFELDIFKLKFNRLAGYGIYSEGNIDLLLIKLERLSECCEQAFREFLGVEDFSLVNKNVATNKYYSDAYRNILKRLIIPAEKLEGWYSAGQLRHFYADDEITHFIDRWSGIAKF